MKTQINNLHSGSKNQILNSNVDYSNLPGASNHAGYAGTNRKIVDEIWKKVIYENESEMKILLFGEETTLKAMWSVSRKSCTYVGQISAEQFAKTGVIASKKHVPYITINCGNIIEVRNGGKSYKNICPSLIEIL